MKISTKARYGLRALVDLAVHSTGEPVPLVYVATRQQLSVNYLEQVFSLLKKSNILKSIKGAQGGYIFARKTKEITVADVIRALEGDILVVEEEPRRNDVSLLCQNMQECLQKQVWDKITASICETVEGITIEDLVREYQMLRHDDFNMYYI